MRADKGNIDNSNSLADKFAGHELPPDDGLWNSISKDLEVADSRFVKKRLIIWRGLAFFFVGVLLVFLGVNYYTVNDSGKTVLARVQKSQDAANNSEADQIPNDDLVSKINTTASFDENESLTIIGPKHENNNVSEGSNTITSDIQSSTNKMNVNVNEPYPIISYRTKDVPLESSSDIDLIPNSESLDYLNTAAVSNENEVDSNIDVTGLGSSEEIKTENVRLPLIALEQFNQNKNYSLEPYIPHSINKSTKIDNPFFIGLSFAPSYTHRILKDDPNSGPTLFNKDFYDSREKGEMNYNYSLELGYRVNEYLTIRSGVGRAKYSSTFIGSNIPVLYDTINGRFNASTSSGEIEFNDNQFEGESQVNNGQVNEQNNQNNEELESVENGRVFLSYTSQQKMSYVQIPLSLEAGITKNKFRFYLNAGVTFNFLTTQSSELKLDNIGVIFQENNSEVRKFNLNSIVGIGVEYNVFRNVSVYIEPQFNYSFLSLNPANSVKNNPFSLGTNTGFKFYF